jgi:hypothetical protein
LEQEFRFRLNIRHDCGSDVNLIVNGGGDVTTVVTGMCAAVVISITDVCACLLTGVHAINLALLIRKFINFILIHNLKVASYIKLTFVNYFF